MRLPCVLASLFGLAAFGYATSAAAAPEPCSDALLALVRAPGTADADFVRISCHLELEPTDVITKKLILEGPDASGVTVRCNGATLRGGALDDIGTSLEIRSQRSGTYPDYTWRRPENISVSDCTIEGGVRIWGMANGGAVTPAKPSSRTAGHTARARAAAPRNITLERLDIVTAEPHPLYIALGVTHVKLLDSELRGKTKGVAIYLDAESGYNTVRGNYIHPSTTKRELIAIDGSSDNRIIDNRFSALNRGGIYIYRNCGEAQMPRHNHPRRNQIINNSFFYRRYSGGNPAVYIGSRDGAHGFPKEPGYCDGDAAYDVGSAVSDRDFARDNVVMQNQIVRRSVGDMIRVRNPDHDSPNYIAHNETVTTIEARKSGCFLETAYSRSFLEDGQQTEVAVKSGNSTKCVVQRCNDGVLETTGACGIRVVPFQCSKSGDNEGCEVTATCGSNQRILAASAACNLEHGTVSSGTVAGLKPGELLVDRESSEVTQGRCRVGSTAIDRRWSIVRGAENAHSTTASCREHDKNGGDCHIRGVLYCRTTLGTVSVPPGKVLPKPKVDPLLPKVVPSGSLKKAPTKLPPGGLPKVNKALK